MIRWCSITGLIAVLLFCTACSHQLVLHNTPVPIKQTAKLGTPASVFVDRVHVPFILQNQIGRKKNFAGDFLAWIKTDSDMAAWAENEINSFLKRHGHTIVSDLKKADYILICDVTDIKAEKRNRWDNNDTFNSTIELNMKIKKVREGITVFNRLYATSYNAVRMKEKEAANPDEKMLNYCLSMVFQKALEQVRLDFSKK